MSSTLQIAVPEIKNNLVKLRNGRSVLEVAAALGITRTAYYSIENDSAFPSRKTLEKICAYYRCDVGDVYTNGSSRKNIA